MKKSNLVFGVIVAAFVCVYLNFSVNTTLRFNGSNRWHTYAYLFSTANVTYMYKVMMPIHCMQASFW